jgi:hypothetical protein
MSALSKLFWAHFSIPLRRVSSFIVFFSPTIDDHGSPVIYRSASVRPKHLSDQSFDHDHFFKLPWQGAGCPIKWTIVLCSTTPVQKNSYNASLS